MEGITTDESANKEWKHRDDGSITHHGQSVAIEDGIYKLFAGSQTYAGKEDTQSYLSYHQIGRDGIVSNQVEFGTQETDKDGYHQRATGQSELKWSLDSGEIEGNVGNKTAERNTQEDRNEVGDVETLDGIAQTLLCMADCQLANYDGDLVAHLKLEVGCGNEFYTRTVNMGDVGSKERAYAELGQCLSIDFGTRDKNTA